VRWNPVNGNWFLTGSRDSKIKVFDIRKTEKEFNCFEGHDDQIAVVAWHPFKEDLFASASSAPHHG
jgi:WD40 repeat protein